MRADLAINLIQVLQKMEATLAKTSRKEDHNWALKMVMHLLDESNSDLLEELYSEKEVEQFREFYGSD